MQTQGDTPQEIEQEHAGRYQLPPPSFLTEQAASRPRDTQSVRTRPPDLFERYSPPQSPSAPDTRDRALAAALGQIIWAATPQGELTEGLDAWQRFTGLERARGDSWDWLDAVHPDDRYATEQAWRHALASKQTYAHEFRMRRYDGVYCTLLARAVPVTSNEGAVSEWMGACLDITERAQKDKAMRENEGRMRLTFERAPVGIGHISPAGRFLLANAKLCNIAGYSSEKLLRLNVRRLILPDDLASLLDAFKDVRDGAQDSVAVEKRYVRPDGAIFWANLALSAVREPQTGAIIHYIIIVEDISARKESEKERERLREHAQKAGESLIAQQTERATLINTLTDALFVLDRDGNITESNDTYASMFGLTDEAARKAFAQKSIDERGAALHVLDGNGDPLSPARYPSTRILNGETLNDNSNVDIHIHSLDGTPRCLNVTGAPLRDATGAVTGAVGIYRDVTERRRVERLSQDSLAVVRAMAELLVKEDHEPAEGDAPPGDAPPGAAQTAQRLVELARSALACRHVALLSWDPETDLLQPYAFAGFATGVDGDPAPHLHDYLDDNAIMRLLEDDEPLALNLVDRRPPMAPTYHNLGMTLIAPMRMQERLMGLMVIDVEDARHDYSAQEKETAQIIARLAAMTLEREELVAEQQHARASAVALRKASEQMDEFLSMASHELRTPLTSVKAYIQIGERRLRNGIAAVSASTDEETTPALAELIDVVEQATIPLQRANQHTDALNQLVGDLLDASRIQSKRLGLTLEPVDILAVVRDAIERKQRAHPERDILFERPENPTIFVEADRIRLIQVVENYLANALKYSPGDQPVTVAVVPIEQGRKVRVDVRDRGPGLPESEIPRIWERFHRTPGIRTQSGVDGGLGLGLYISRGIIELLHGGVAVDTQEGHGASFQFTLPILTD